MAVAPNVLETSAQQSIGCIELTNRRSTPIALMRIKDRFGFRRVRRHYPNWNDLRLEYLLVPLKFLALRLRTALSLLETSKPRSLVRATRSSSAL